MVCVNVPVDDTIYAYNVAFVGKVEDDGSFAISITVTKCPSDDHSFKNTCEIDDPETDLTGLPKDIYEAIKSTLDKFIESVGCVDA